MYIHIADRQDERNNGIHGEDHIEKLIDGQYALLSSADMVRGRYVSR
jgi:hypothetical protein